MVGWSNNDDNELGRVNNPDSQDSIFILNGGSVTTFGHHVEAVFIVNHLADLKKGTRLETIRIFSKAGFTEVGCIFE